MKSLDGSKIPKYAEKETAILEGILTDLVKNKIISEEVIFSFCMNVIIDNAVNNEKDILYKILSGVNLLKELKQETK